MSPVLDMSVVEELIALSDDGDPELLLDLIQMFLDDGPTKVASILEGVQQQDFDKVERAAHSLKGSAGNLGATLLQDTCERLQIIARTHELQEAQEVSSNLESRFTAAKSALQELQDAYSS